MIVTLLGSTHLNYWIEPQQLPWEFHNKRIIIEAKSTYASPSWRYAGWIRQIYSIPDIGITRSSLRKVYFGTQILEFNAVTLNSYKLEYQLPGWLQFIDLRIWEQEEAEKTWVSKTVSVSNEASRIIDTNFDRKGLTIFNPSSKIVYLDTLSTVSTSLSNCMVPLYPDGFYEVSSLFVNSEFYAITEESEDFINIREFI